MSFAFRQIDLVFNTPNQTPLFLQNIKCLTTITNPGGQTAWGQLQLKVFGMTLDQMNTYSSTGASFVALQEQSVIVYAGNKGGAMNQVFAGTIFKSYMDFSHQPEVSFTCAAQAGFFPKGNANAANTYPGDQNAEDIIEALVKQLGNPWTFVNYQKKAHAVLQNQYVYGSVIDQISTVARAARFPVKFENNQVTIWPNYGVCDDTTVEIGPTTGMVGYPSYWESGFIVKTEFNPTAVNGRAVKLTSDIPKSNGTWPIIESTHELSTLTPDGPWFTTVKLSSPPHVSPN